MSYNPNAAALSSPPWLTAFLSQRDLGLQVPINYVTRPGVAVSSACFADGVFVDGRLKECVSNLLAVGFRRFGVDVFWDEGRRVWGLCPVEVPGEEPGTPSGGSSATSVESTSKETITSATFSQDGAGVIGLTPTTAATAGEEVNRLVRRQASLSGSTISSASTSAGSGPATAQDSTFTATLTASSTGVAATQFPSQDGPLYELGPYNCTASIDLSLFASILGDFLSTTANTLQATLTYVSLNLHAAAPISNPTGPAATLNSSSLPRPAELLSTIISSNLSSYLYTPTRLREQRADLNASWYSVSTSLRPFSEYFTTETGPQNSVFTLDGWPSESYIEFTNALRVLIAFGTVDPQLGGYNFSGDQEDIFPSNYISDPISTSLSSDGTITQGCLFNANETSVAATNNSWAVADYTSPASTPSDLNTTIANLTTCGISPFLNSTLDYDPNANITADSASALPPYQIFARSTIWSWAPGQPRNVSSDENDASRIRCAAIDLSTDPDGRWHIADCSSHYLAACREPTAPYVWRISDDHATYSESDGLCPDGFDFAVPRTALENMYLRAAVQARRDSGENADEPVWVNFNDLDVSGCWVAGVNGTCPYVSNSNADERRTVIVPTVAAVIIFLLAVLTFFVKCAANRRNSRRKRRRRGDGGWDYEGVPS